MTEFQKAILREIKWTQNQTVEDASPVYSVTVQFNPETLKLAYANQRAGGDQRGGSASQFVGKGTTKLTLDLWFDVTTPLIGNDQAQFGDVRKLTEKVNYFIKPKAAGRNKWLPPGVRFIWGSFLFEGTVDSINETLDYFSEDGVPLRAMLQISISSQEIQIQAAGDAAGTTPTADPIAGGSARSTPPGRDPLSPARQGDSVQQMAARAGKPFDWKAIASFNGIENPRLLTPGRLLNLNAPKINISGGSLSTSNFGISGGASLSGSGGVGGISGGGSASASASLDADGVEGSAEIR